MRACSAGLAGSAPLTSSAHLKKLHRLPPPRPRPRPMGTQHEKNQRPLLAEFFLTCRSAAASPCSHLGANGRWSRSASPLTPPPRRRCRCCCCCCCRARCARWQRTSRSTRRQERPRAPPPARLVVPRTAAPQARFPPPCPGAAQRAQMRPTRQSPGALRASIATHGRVHVTMQYGTHLAQYSDSHWCVCARARKRGAGGEGQARAISLSPPLSLSLSRCVSFFL